MTDIWNTPRRSFASRFAIEQSRAQLAWQALPQAIHIGDYHPSRHEYGNRSNWYRQAGVAELKSHGSMLRQVGQEKQRIKALVG